VVPSALAELALEDRIPYGRSGSAVEVVWEGRSP